MGKLKIFMLIISNLYRQAMNILHKVIQKMLLAHTVYTKTRSADGVYWKNHITLCIAIKNHGIHSVCHGKNPHNIATINIQISLTVSNIEVQGNPVKPDDIFFPACKKLINIRAYLEIKNLGFLYRQARHM